MGTINGSRAITSSLLAILFSTAACADLPSESSASVGSITYFNAPHYPAATDSDLPKIRFVGEQFDPFCDAPPPFVAQATADGFLLTRLDSNYAASKLSAPGGPSFVTRASCDRSYNNCVSTCRRLKGRVAALCYAGCMAVYATCLARAR